MRSVAAIMHIHPGEHDTAHCTRASPTGERAFASVKHDIAKSNRATASDALEYPDMQA